MGLVDLTMIKVIGGTIRCVAFLRNLMIANRTGWVSLLTLVQSCTNC